MNSLMEKLMISKKIMEKSDQISRGSLPNTNSSYNQDAGFSQSVQLQEFSAPAARYNIPEEFAPSTPQPQPIKQVSNPLERIQNSKLPDAIKKLMIEHPIAQVKPLEPTISDDVIEAASRLMKKDKEKTNVPNTQVSYPQGLSANDIKKIVRETMEEVLSEQGLMVESETKSSDSIQIKVGQHLFVGKISKIKKLQ
jgi:hypothetical protein